MFLVNFTHYTIRWYIVSNTCINHRRDGGEVSVLTKSKNVTLLTKALAFGWKYKKEYERGIGIEALADQEQRASRTINI
jgi:hypothetical protein